MVSGLFFSALSDLRAGKVTFIALCFQDVAGVARDVRTGPVGTSIARFVV